MPFTTSHGAGLPPLPLAVLGLAGYSTVGKDTLCHELARHFSFTMLSAGHVFKEILATQYGLPEACYYGNGPERNTPHPKLPWVALPENLVAHRQGLPQISAKRHLSPRELELRLIGQMPESHLVWRNRQALESLIAQGTPVVFNGYRWPLQHSLLLQFKGKLAQQNKVVLRVRLLSPQVPTPPPHSAFEGMLVTEAFEGMLWNDKTHHPSAMMQQLNLLVHQATGAPLL